MSEENCPRCGHAGEAPGIKDYGTAKYWSCGSWQGESGAIYESELCETRQELRSEKAAKEKAEAELLSMRKILDESLSRLWAATEPSDIETFNWINEVRR